MESRNCREDQKLSQRFSPLAGIQLMERIEETSMPAIGFMFQSPCGDSVNGKHGTCRSLTPLLLLFQSPCGDSVNGKFARLQLLTHQQLKFQSPCGDSVNGKPAQA